MKAINRTMEITSHLTQHLFRKDKTNLPVTVFR